VDEVAVKNIRPYVVCFIARDIDLSGGRLRQFIQAQTKLHETVCAKRVAATIATHDLAKIKGQKVGILIMQFYIYLIDYISLSVRHSLYIS